MRREYVRLFRNDNLKLHSQSSFRSVGHLFALCSFGCSLFYRLFGFTECKPQPGTMAVYTCVKTLLFLTKQQHGMTTFSRRILENMKYDGKCSKFLL